MIRVDGGCYYFIFNSDRSNKYMLFWRNGIINANGFCCRLVFNDHKAVGKVSYFLPVITVDDGCYCFIFNSDQSNKCMLFWGSSIIKANGYCCRGVFNNEFLDR